MGGGAVPMNTEICAELGAMIAAVSSAPYIQFSLILDLLNLEVQISKNADGLPSGPVYAGQIGGRCPVVSRLCEKWVTARVLDSERAHSGGRGRIFQL
jgi:hypothetical protein